MNNKRIAFVLVTVLIVSIVSIAFASNIMPLADSEFDSATPSLSSRKDVTFRCATYETKKSISVTDCWLEKKTGGKWEKVRNLTPPSTVFTNAFAYVAVKNYSSEIGTGTYRVWATFNADGHEVTRCSNERTF